MNKKTMPCKIFSLTACLLAASYASSQAADKLNYTLTWFGNSFGTAWQGGHGTPVKHVQQHIDGAFVTPDGTVLANSGWDEGGIDCGVYKNADLIGRLDFGAGGWGRDGGDAVAANDTYIFAAMTQRGGIGNSGNPNKLPNEPPDKSTWYCIERLKRSNDHSPLRPASFPAGRGYNGAMLVINTDGGPIHGVAVDNHNRLYVSDTPNNTIRVYDANSMEPVRDWRLERPGQIAVARDGTLWIMQMADARNRPRIIHCSASGTTLPGSITFWPKMEPQGFCIDNQDEILVADSGVDNNIKIYDTRTLWPITATRPFSGYNGFYGAAGGIFSDDGKMGDLKFFHPVAVGTDNAGHFYVCSNPTNFGSGAAIESYDLKTRRRAPGWPHPLYGLLWLDSAAIDPGAEQNIYSGDKHFVLDYNQTTPGAGWTFKGITCDPYQYPQDARLSSHEDTGSASVFARRIRGALFLYLTNQYSGSLRIYRFGVGEVAIPCGYIAKEHIKKNEKSADPAWPPHQPEKGEWIWRDANGNGAFDAGEYEQPATATNESAWEWGVSVDSEGNIWSVRSNGTIRKLRLQGLDAHGSPIYNYASAQTVQAPDFVTELMRAEYRRETDSMYLSCYTKEHPHTGDEWGILGTEILCIGEWSKGNRTPRARIVLPYDSPKTLFAKSMCVEGDYIFATEGRLPTVHVYNTTTGQEVGTLNPGPEVGGLGGWVDMTYGIQAFKRKNGDYVVIEEEDGYIKNLVYRWKP